MCFAFHRLYIHNGDIVSFPNIILDSEGYYIGYDIIKSEQPFVQWIGGCCILLPESLLPANGNTIHYLLSEAEKIKTPCRYCLWHLHGVPSDIDINIPVYSWIRIK